MKIDVDELNYSESEPYYADGAKALIKQALEHNPKNNGELIEQIEAYESDLHGDAELKQLKKLAINALEKSGIR